ncbi:MAG: malate/lactate/ureidoglycolate dehydrogenase [Comamonas sp.]
MSSTPHALIAPATLHRWVHDLWTAAGSNAREAALTADHLVQANLSGHDSHGVGMVPRYVLSWQANALQLNQSVRVVHDGGSLLNLDGQCGMGQAVAEEAMALAIARARQHGVCILGLHHSHHIGRVGHWAEQACSAGMIAIHFVNVLSSALVAPWGGRQARFGTNPFTIGVPVEGAPPLLLDFATSAIAMGKVRVALNQGQEVPPGCLLDADGAPTTDPQAMYPATGDGMGALQTFGGPVAGHKGYALAFMCELLGAAVAGGQTIRPETLQRNAGVWNNMLAIVFDPARLGSGATLGHEVQAFIDWVRSAECQPGMPGIAVPGEPEQAMRRARAQGIPLDTATLAELDRAAAQVQAARGSGPGPLSALVQAGA